MATLAAGLRTRTRPARACRILLAVACCLACLGGCSGGRVERHRLSGNVTFRGQPVPEGHISFESPEGSGFGGGFAFIKNGRYDTADGGRGNLGGPHLVRISGFSGQAADRKNPEAGGAALFPNHEETAELPTRIATKDFDVPVSAGP